MTDTDELAARLYPDMAKPAEPAVPPLRIAEMPEPAATDSDPTPADGRGMDFHADAVDEPQAPGDAPLTVDELVSQEQTLAQRLYGDGSARPDTPEGYVSMLGETFGTLEHQARYDGNEEDTAALAAGKRETAALMHELQVPRNEARELTQALGDWHQRAPLSEDANWDRKVKTLGELEKEWGRETHARIELAKRTAAEACKRMPWLADLLKAGAGNDPKLIKRFAEIGLRQARRASKVGNNRNG